MIDKSAIRSRVDHARSVFNGKPVFDAHIRGLSDDCEALLAELDELDQKYVGVIAVGADAVEQRDKAQAQVAQLRAALEDIERGPIGADNVPSPDEPAEIYRLAIWRWSKDRASEALAATPPAPDPRDTQIADLRTALERIAGFAPGNGDVCEIIARRAREALAATEEG